MMTRETAPWFARSPSALAPVWLGLVTLLAACEPHTILELPAEETPEPDPSPPVVEPEPLDDSGAPASEPEPDAGPSPPPDSGATAPALRHRYSFSGEGVVVADSVGGADGVVLGGAVLSGAGSVSLDGLDDYVQLPDGLVSGLAGASVMVWATWQGAACWERLFDFGNNVVNQGRVEADTSFFLTPHRCGAEPMPLARLEFRLPPEPGGYRQFTVGGPEVLTAAAHQYVVTLEPATQLMRLYVDGSEVGSRTLVEANTGLTAGLAEVRDLDNWLGRSQYLADAFFTGSFDELRIYAVALDASAVQAAFEAGPETVPQVD